MVEVQSPSPMFCLAGIISAGLAQFVTDLFDELGPATIDSPWGIVLYADEVDPADQLMGKHARKYSAVCWSILAFGCNALAREELWWTFCTGRSTLVRVGRSHMTQCVPSPGSSLWRRCRPQGLAFLGINHGRKFYQQVRKKGHDDDKLIGVLPLRKHEDDDDEMTMSKYQ